MTTYLLPALKIQCKLTKYHFLLNVRSSQIDPISLSIATEHLSLGKFKQTKIKNNLLQFSIIFNVLLIYWKYEIKLKVTFSCD